MRATLRRFSFRFAEEILNSKLTLKRELEDAIAESLAPARAVSRPALNAAIENQLTAREWIRQPRVFEKVGAPGARMDFLKGRVGVEVGFTHASFIGMDLLKFQIASYSALDRIDMGVYITTTSHFQSVMKGLGEEWGGSVSFEKVERYLPEARSAIQVPVYVIGIDT